MEVDSSTLGKRRAETGTPDRESENRSRNKPPLQQPPSDGACSSTLQPVAPQVLFQGATEVHTSPGQAQLLQRFRALLESTVEKSEQRIIRHMQENLGAVDAKVSNLKAKVTADRAAHDKEMLDLRFKFENLEQKFEKNNKNISNLLQLRQARDLAPTRPQKTNQSS